MITSDSLIPSAASPANRRVLLLSTEARLASIVANELKRRLDAELFVVIEPAEKRSVIVRRRARLLGWPTAISQLAAGVVTRVFARNLARCNDIIRTMNYDTRSPNGPGVYHVSSINDAETMAILRDVRPAVIAVYGTRILSGATLAAAGVAPVINYHAGINPKYRGQQPAYWALTQGDSENAGVTIHLVDAGVDTGSVLYQARSQFAAADNIGSYFYVQLADALPLFERAINDALIGDLRTHVVDLPSRKWFPPTLGQYLRNGLQRGVW